MRGRGYWRESDGESLTPEEAYDTWASYAYDILVGVARSYHAVIEYGALAEEAQTAFWRPYLRALPSLDRQDPATTSGPLPR